MLVRPDSCSQGGVAQRNPKQGKQACLVEPCFDMGFGEDLKSSVSGVWEGMSAR